MRFTFSALLSAQRPQVSIRKLYMLTDPNREPKRFRREASAASGKPSVSSWEKDAMLARTDFQLQATRRLQGPLSPRLLLFLLSREENTRSIRLRVFL